MDTLDMSLTQPSAGKYFDQIQERRAAKHEFLRGRNNVTSCRSPTREFDTRLLKDELHYKRHLEFQRRRPVSPDQGSLKSMKERYHPAKRKPLAKIYSAKHPGLIGESETLKTNIKVTPLSDGHSLVMFTPGSGTGSDDPSTSEWVSLWSEPIPVARQGKNHTKKQVAPSSTSTPVIQEPTQQKVEGKKTNTRTAFQNGKIPQAEKVSLPKEMILQKKTLHETSVQTEPGFVTVKALDIHRLADYLKEALWREEAVKKKLAVLQENASTLANSSNTIWTAHCNEDLLRNQIKALEAQLQVCLQTFPKDGMKKLLVQMEKQKLVYEEKALAALQKATQEKAEALSKADILQEALQGAKVEALRWQGLYEELKQNTGQLKESQELCIGQLQQLHSQLQLSRGREAELTEIVESLHQEKKELLYNISVLEEDNQMLRDEIQSLRDDSAERRDSVVQMSVPPGVPEENQVMKRSSQLEKELHQTKDKLQQKERECEELETELEAVEQECQSSQARLTQCRDELRQLSHRHSRRNLCGSWRKVCLFLVLLLAVAAVAMLWFWHPPFRDQLEDVYSDIETRIEGYLMEMASPRHSGCFRPI
ncbi:TRAF3-interacting JNK-activating modulator [Lampris incognitus]|uniref:TRAF3-interacting JNK-activating modulator n=1 Tax=Lampris incognitus TaxID=2546036 RepID=UPI0024B4DB69|nr:TRAF3-interacting JNK-activating modulator [Lampris incognitus]